jgi:hypothetical protein
MLWNQISSEGEGFGTGGNDARRDRTKKEQKANESRVQPEATKEHG